IGGLQPVVVPFMPADALMVTSLDNLSLYWQIDGRRRYIKEEPEKNRIANFESSNDCYVVEDYGRGAVVENIKVADLVLGTKRIGGLQPVVVPFMPADALMVTSLDNLSLYWQIDG
ncbi:hypothetical protein C7E14_22775, partial [Stenotrophomonas maltophilia]